MFHCGAGRHVSPVNLELTFIPNNNNNNNPFAGDCDDE